MIQLFAYIAVGIFLCLLLLSLKIRDPILWGFSGIALVFAIGIAVASPHKKTYEIYLYKEFSTDGLIAIFPSKISTMHAMYNCEQFKEVASKEWKQTLYCFDKRY